MSEENRFTTRDGYTINGRDGQPGLLQRVQTASFFSCAGIVAAFAPIYTAQLVFWMKGLLPDRIESMIPAFLVITAAVISSLFVIFCTGAAFTPSDFEPEEHILMFGMPVYLITLVFYGISLGVLKHIVPTVTASGVNKVFLLSGLEVIGITIVFLIVVWLAETVSGIVSALKEKPTPA